jgi:prepilin-type N-terminal cleavage/methylation domain-containing protein
MKKSKIHAFTLIELLVVIAIVGILTGFIFVSMNGAVNASKDARRKSDLGNISRAIMAYMAQNNNSFPETSTSCTMGSGGTCSNLGTNLAPYLNTIPLDPNGTNYTYSYVSASSKFVLQSTLSNSNVYQFDSSSGFSTLSYASTCVSGGGLTCTETTDGSYVVDKYTLSGTATGTTTWQTPVGVSRVEYLVIGGGGSGGGAAAGGGGFLTATGYTVVPGNNLSVIVGAGGSYTVNGGNSSFSSILAYGGGAGGNSNNNGSNGGSGGGSGGGLGYFSAGNGTSGQGNNGGANNHQGSGTTYPGPGGGGAGGVGITCTSVAATNGGPGLQSSITGTAVYYAAGGGGGSWNAGAGSGGSGIGGNGAQNAPGGNAVANTGSGGGGGGHGNNGGSGSSGIVVIRYIHP